MHLMLFLMELNNMSCDECQKIQDKAFNKNIPDSINIAYIRVDIANIAVVGCNTHIKMVIDRLRKYTELEKKGLIK